MSHTAKIRLGIFIIITIVCALLIFFEPRLNIGSKEVISIYEALRTGAEPARVLLTKFFVIVAAIFGAMFFLIGLGPQENKEPEIKKEVKSREAAGKK